MANEKKVWSKLLAGQNLPGATFAFYAFNQRPTKQTHPLTKDKITLKAADSFAKAAPKKF